MKNKINRYTLPIISFFVFVSGYSIQYRFIERDYDEDKFAREIRENLSYQLQLLEESVSAIMPVLVQKDFSFSKINFQGEYPLYIFKDDELVYWSDYRYVPDYKVIRGHFNLKFFENEKGKFLIRKWRVNPREEDIDVFGLVPLYVNYPFGNDYLQPHFNQDIFPSPGVEIRTVHQGSIDICLKQEAQCLFGLTFQAGYHSADQLARGVTTFLYLLSSSLLLAFIYELGAKLAVSRSFWLGLGVIGLGIFSLRIFLLLINFPNVLLYTALFDSRIFASSRLNQSLGDLLLNVIAILLICSFIFQFYGRGKITAWLTDKPKALKMTVSMLLAAITFFALQYPYLTFQTIYHNSQLSFDITQSLDFGFLRIVAFVVVMLTVFSFFALSHAIYKWVRKVLKGENFDMLVAFAGGMLIFSISNLISRQVFLPVVLLGPLYFFIIHTFELPDSLVRVRYKTFLYLLSCIITMAILGAYSIYQFESERINDNKVRFANRVLIENDTFAEFLLSEAAQKIQDDIFIQSRLSSPYLSKNIVAEKIRKVHLNQYFDKYKIQIYLFNANGRPFVGTTTPLNYNNIERRFARSEYQTDFRNLYFIKQMGPGFSRRYFQFIAMKRRGIKVGYIVLDLSLKKFIPQSVYPELLVDRRFVPPFLDRAYTYAFFSGGKMIYSSGMFNYSREFDLAHLRDPDLYAEGLTLSEYNHLALQDEQGRIVVVSTPVYPLMRIFTGFSFLFLIQVFILLIYIAAFLLYFLFYKITINYSARIQLYLNLAFFLPLFAVSITTLSIINSDYRREVITTFIAKAENISTNIANELNAYFEDVTVDKEEITNKLVEVAQYADVDANLFSVQGRLLATNQPAIYQLGLLAEFINPAAFESIVEAQDEYLITDENVGKLGYKTAYASINSFTDGKLLGVLSIPFFESEQELERRQIIALSNIINIFTIIFLIFLAISYLASKWLTFPLTFITQKLKKTTLTGFNEPLNWKTNDEIGLMVGEYNRMLINLEESKKALARSEKESAWREIAKQVAHEIKNPLTPMKLTLQHLDRKMKSTQSQEAGKPIKTLLHHVDLLNDIATSFSTFAQMPIPEHERYELVGVVRKTIHLYKSNENVKIHLINDKGSIEVMGDEQLMGRIISNLLLNAIQSVDGGPLDIKLQILCPDKRRVLISVEDNGPGIPDEIAEKVFLPRFSTKSTGSGIGLAISKRGVEQAGGKIWFETELGRGTAFYIELPLAGEKLAL